MGGASLIFSLVLLLEYACPSSSLEVLKNGDYYQQEAAQNLRRRVVIMSHGRSGSTAIASCIDNFASLEWTPNFAARSATTKIWKEGPYKCCSREIFGGGDKVMLKIINPKKKVKEFFENFDQKEPALTGFKWKPLFFNDAYVEALEWVAGEKIPVLFSTRNPLDVALSVQKHAAANSTLESHCAATDQKCLEAHRSIKTTVNVTLVVAFIRKLFRENSDTVQNLRKLNVTHTETTYEGLFKDDPPHAVVEWKRVIRSILGSHGASRVDTGSVQLCARTSATNLGKRSNKVENYNELISALSVAGPEFIALADEQQASFGPDLNMGLGRGP